MRVSPFHSLLLLCLLPLFALDSRSTAWSYPTSSALADSRTTLAITPAVALSGPARPELARQMGDLFAFDLGMSGFFTVTTPAEAKLVLQSSYAIKKGSITLECRLVDRVTNRELDDKRYSGPLNHLRRMGHSFSDEVLRMQTRQKGPFTGRIAYVARISGHKEIYTMDYDGRNPQRITNNGSINLNPDFAPSGKELIYTSYKEGNPDLYRRNLSTGSEVTISSRPGLNAMGTYTPDGRRIAEVMTKDGNAETYLIGRDGRQLARLTRNPAIDVSPSWSPDGSRLVFVSDRAGKPQLFVMDADGGHVRRLTTNGAYNVTPRWSPNGDRIVYARQARGGFQIYAINPDGTNDTRLTTLGSNEHQHWSPDGRFIVFSSTRNGGEAIFLMRADGSAQTQVSRGNQRCSQPTWSAAS